jgi:hypothetical protein
MKTLKLIDQYIKLYEQDDPAAAEVDVNVEEPAAEEPVAEEPPVLTTPAEIWLTKLAALAFSYDATPTEKEIVNGLSAPDKIQKRPRMVTDRIKDYLRTSNNAFAVELSEIQ